MHAISVVWPSVNSFVSKLAQAAMHALCRGGLLLSLSLLFLTAALCAFVIYRAKRVGYVNRSVTPLSFHLLLIAGTGLAALWLCWNMVRGQVSVLAILPVLIAAAGITGLIRFRLYGPIASILFFWCTGWLVEQPHIAAALQSRTELAAISPAGQAAVCIASDILIMGAIGLEILLGAVTVYAARYYAQRRFLFPRLKHAYFDPLCRCPNCGAFAVGNEPMCSTCGYGLSDTDLTRLSFRLLERPRFAVQKPAEESPAHKIKSRIAGILKPILVLILIIVIVFIPGIVSNMTFYLTSGAADAVYQYAERLAELYNDPDLIEDEIWAETYNKAASGLYDIDLRCLSVNTRIVKSSDLSLFIQYSEASMEQVFSMDAVARAINDRDLEDLSELLIRFDDSQTAQELVLSNSRTEALSAINAKTRLEDLTQILTDSFRFYSSYLPLSAWAGIVCLAGVLFLVLAVRLRIKNGPLITTPYEIPALAEAGAVETQDQIDWQKRHKRDQLIITAVAVVFAAVMILPSHLGSRTGTEPNGYSETIQAVTIRTVSDVTVWLNSAQSDPNAVSDEDLSELAGLLRDQLNGLASLSVCSPEDIPYHYALVHEKLMSAAPDITASLEELLSQAESGIVPASAQISAGLAAENKLMTLGAGIAIGSLYGSLQDLMS